jgi:hypothetical protein
VGNDGFLAPYRTTVAEAVACPTMSEAAASNPTISTGLVVDAPSSPPQMAAATPSAGVDDNTVKEPEVIMGHPSLRVPGAVSPSEVIGTTHFVLNQVYDVLRQERAEVRQKRINMMEILFARR